MNVIQIHKKARVLLSETYIRKGVTATAVRPARYHVHDDEGVHTHTIECVIGGEVLVKSNVISFRNAIYIYKLGLVCKAIDKAWIRAWKEASK